MIPRQSLLFPCFATRISKTVLSSSTAAAITTTRALNTKSGSGMYSPLVFSFAKNNPSNNNNNSRLRWFATTHHAPGSDPLDIFRKECMARNLCDAAGNRLPGAHWTFSIAVAHSNPLEAPSLRTVGIERVTPHGIDFCLKRGSPVADRLADNSVPVSVLYVRGQFKPGQSAEQWRGEGHVERLPLGEILEYIPHYTICSMVGSKRLAKELRENSNNAVQNNNGGGERSALLSRAHFTEIMQKTRIELENGDISMQELEQAIRAFRFQPDRMENMTGGPDSVMWERFEWQRDTAGDCPEGSIPWKDVTRLVPH